MWFTKEDFNNKVKNIRRSSEVEPINICEFSISAERLAHFIGTVPDDEVLEFTDPSPCLRWYGCVDDLFFQVIFYLFDKPIAAIAPFLTMSEETSWVLLKELQLPSEFFKNVQWIKGYKNSPFSVYSIDVDNLVFDLYRAKNEEEAQELVGFLNECGYEKKLFTGLSQNSTFQWVAERNGEEIARYKSRYSTETFALRKSRIVSGKIKVFCPTDDSYSSFFCNGKQLDVKNGIV